MMFIRCAGVYLDIRFVCRYVYTVYVNVLVGFCVCVVYAKVFGVYQHEKYDVFYKQWFTAITCILHSTGICKLGRIFY